MFFTVIFTLWLISPANEQVEGVVETKMSIEECLNFAEQWVNEPLALNVKRAEFRCIRIFNILPFIKREIPAPSLKD